MTRTARNLLFHYVGTGPYALSADALGASVASHLSEGLRPAAVGEYLRRPPGPDAFTVSFDDAHRSVLEAVPVLAELGVTPALFVPTALVGLAEWCLDWGELRELAALGWEIHSHGHRHRRMSWREYGETRVQRDDRLARELRRSRELLRERVGVDSRVLAYPYGEAAAPDAVREAGFATALTVALDFGWEGDRLRVPRIDAVPVAWTGDEPVGISVVVPACDRVPLLREVVRRLHGQSYPEERYEVLVVDDGSTADLSRELAPWLDRVRLLPLPASDRTFRAGQARQAGADAARHEVLAFLDADVAVDTDFLWALDWCHRRDPRAVVLGALSGYNLHDLGVLHSLDEVAACERLTGEHLAVIPDRSRGPALATCLDNPAWLERPWELCYTGNLSLRRALLAEAAGFSAAFSGWGFEDVDLGLRLHRVGVGWVHSLWALGYHLTDEDEGPPSNPFRRPRPTLSDFAGVLANLDTLEAEHPGRPEVASFCEGVRADVAETCSRPHTVGVECGDRPGGRDAWSLLDRLAYAEKVGATDLYFLGGDLLLRGDCSVLLEAARGSVPGRITAETSGYTLASRRLEGLDLDAVVVEVRAGAGDLEEASTGVAAARTVGIEVSAKLVVDGPEAADLERALAWIRAEGLDLWDAWVLPGADPVAVAAAVPPGCEVHSS